jgi:tetratricopeptide (TPR) repeat protein
MARAHPDTGAARSSSDLGFALGAADGHAVLTLSRRELFGWLGVDELVLEIAELEQPPDLDAQPERFQRRRTRVRSARLQVSPQGLARLAALAGPALSGMSITELALQARDGHLTVMCHVHMGDREAEIGYDVYVVAAGAALRVLVARPRVYGFLPEPAPRLAHRITAALLAAAEPAPDSEPGARPGTQIGVQIGGLGRFSIEPLAALLWRMLPPAGWRLPQSGHIGVVALGVRRGGLHLGLGAVPASETERPVLAEAEAAALAEALQSIERADELVRAGNGREAVRVYRQQLAGELHGGEQLASGAEALIVERILAVCAAEPALFDEGRTLAREHRERPALAPAALAALASMAVGDRDHRVAAAHFERLTDTAAAAGDADTAICAALAAARLLRTEDPAGATRMYERVARRRPDHVEASDALLERYAESQRWGDLVALLRRRIEATTDPMRQLPDRLRLAQVLHQHRNDPAAARDELDRARRIDPVHIPALEALIELELASGQRQAALERLGHVANLWLRQGNDAAAARAFVRAAGLWALDGEYEEADAAYREALSLVADDPEALHGAAALAAERGQHQAAAELWTQLDAQGGHAPAQHARYRLALGRSLLAADHSDAAAKALLEATYHGSDATVAEAYVLLAEVHRARHDLDSAATDIGAAIGALSRAAETFFATHPGTEAAAPPPAAPTWPPDDDRLHGSRYLTRAAHLAHERARLLEELGRGDEARADYHRSHALARKVDPVAAHALARSLLQAERARGDIEAQQRWIETLLEDGATGSERVELLLSRADLRRRAVIASDLAVTTMAVPDPGEDAPTPSAVELTAAAERHASLQGSLSDIDQALGGEPTPAQRILALSLRAELLATIGDRKGRAQALAERATLVAGPEDRAEAEAEAVQAWLDAGDAQVALHVAENAVAALAGQVAPEAPEARRLRLLLGETAWRRRAWPTVIEVYAPLVLDEPETAAAVSDPTAPLNVWAHRLGVACEAEAKYEAAIRAFDIAVRAEGATPLQRLESYRALARAHEHAGAVQEAARTFEALARDLLASAGDERERADAWFRAGELWRRHGNMDAAERCFEAALHLAADHLPALDALEALEREQGDHARLAAVLARKLAVASAHPQRQTALLLRLAGLQSEQLGHDDVALETYRRVLEIEPESRPALAFVAAHERKEGRVDAAAALYARLAGTLAGEDEPPRGATPATDRPAPPSGLMEQRVRAAETLVDLAVKEPRLRALARGTVENLAELLPRHPALRALRQRLLDAAMPPTLQIKQVLAAEATAEVQASAANGAGGNAGASAGNNAGAAAAADAAPPVEDAAEPEYADIEVLVPAAAPEAAGPAVAQAAAGDDEPKVDGSAPDQAPDGVSDRMSDLVSDAASGDASVEASEDASEKAHDKAADKAAAVADDQAGDHEAGDDDGADEATLRERADAAAAAGELPRYAHYLRLLAGRIPADAGSSRQRLRRAEVFLELADLYYDQLADRAAARAAMREAADAYGSGSRRDATLRTLAAEALAEQADEEAVAAYEAIAPGRRTVADKTNLAAAYQRMGSNHAALALLEDLERAGTLSEDGAMTLFGLRQERKARAERAALLEDSIPAVGRTEAERRLREALSIYRDELGDAEAAARVQATFDALLALSEADAGAEPPEAGAGAETDADAAQTGPMRRQDLPLALAHVLDDEPDLSLEESLDHASEDLVQPPGQPEAERHRSTDTDPGIRIEHLIDGVPPDAMPASPALPEVPPPRMVPLSSVLPDVIPMDATPLDLPPPVPMDAADEADTSRVDASSRRRRRARKAFPETRVGVPPVAGSSADLGIPLPPIKPLPPVEPPAQNQTLATADTDPAMIPLPTAALPPPALPPPALPPPVLPPPVLPPPVLPPPGSRAGEAPSTLPFGTPAAPPAGEPVTPSLPQRSRTATGKHRRREGRITEPGLVTPPMRKGSRSTITYPGVELDIRKLENAAITTHDPARAAELLTQSLTLRTGRLLRHHEPLDDDARAVLSRLRDVARKSRKYRLLVHGLEAAGAVGGDPQGAAALLREAADILINQLGDETHGLRLLLRAFEATPGDAGLLVEVVRRLHANGDVHRMVDAYQLHIGAVEGRSRARPLFELGCVHRDLLDDPDRAATYFARAHDADPDLVDVWLPLASARLAAGDSAGAARLYDMVLERGSPDADTREWILSRLAALDPQSPEPATPTTPDRPSNRRRGPTVFHAAGGAPRAPSRIEEALRRAATLEARGRADAALVHYRVAAEDDPSDQRPLDALERLHQGRGDMEAYSNLLAELLEITPDARPRARLLWRRGRVYRDHLRREADAYRCFKQAHAADPDDGPIAHDLRRLAMDRGEWPMAAELLRREIAAAPTTEAAGQLEMELAVLYDEKLLDAERARVHYEQALALDPALPGAPRPLARLYELAGRHADAARTNELAAQHARDDSQRSRLLYRAAVSAERASDVPNARRLYHLAALAAPEGDDASASHRALVRLDDQSDASRLELLELELRETASDKRRIDILRQLLARATTSGDRDAADRHARALLDMDGADLSAYLVLKSRAEATQDWSALALLLNARAVSLKDRSERAAVYYDLGRLYQTRLGDPSAAAKAFERALAADPSHPAALEALAELAYDQKDWARARQLYARIRPETCVMPAEEIAYRRGVIAETIGNQREAAESYARAVALVPTHREALGALLRLSLEAGDLARAIDASRALLELMPADDVAAISQARMRLAELCERASDVDAAIEYAELVISEEPGSQPALEALVRLYEQRGDHDSAARTLRRLIGLVPTPQQRAALLHHLGELYHVHLGDLDQAADAYLKSIDLDPTHVPTLRRLLAHYWREADLSELLEIALALAEQAALVDERTDLESLGHVLIAAALRGDERLIRQIVAWLGVRLPDVLVTALSEATSHPGQPVETGALVRVVSEIQSQAPSLSRNGMIERLASNPTTRPLADALRTARP